MSKPLLSPLEAARELDVGVACVERFILHGLLPARALPKSFSIALADLELFKQVYDEFRDDFRAKGQIFIDVGLPRVRISGVYFVGSRSHVKIGHARDIGGRARSLQTSHAEPLQLLAWEDGGQKRERELHQQFASYRERGEWFRPEGTLRDYIARATAWYWGFH